MTTLQATPRVRVAREVAAGLLEGMGDRWSHTRAVAARAEELAVTVPAAERELLVVAAWLHDIGYSPAAHDTGFHPLDGARYLRRHGWPARVCALVAYHSGAHFAADRLALRGALDEFEREESPVSDALTYADQTVGPRGEWMSIVERMAEVLTRHGTSSVQAGIHHVRAPYLLSIADRVTARLDRSLAVPGPAGSGR